MKTKRIAVTLVSLTVSVANAQLRDARQHFVVPAEQVARTIVASFAERGIHVTADQVRLPSDVLANEANPLLEVSGVQQLGRLSTTNKEQASAGVRMRCRTAGTCLPFYAVVTWQEDQDSLAPAKKIVSTPAQLTEQRALKIIKVGARLLFLLEADHARIQMEVISLGSAALGEKVRVTTADHKHTYVAEVLGANLVKGSF